MTKTTRTAARPARSGNTASRRQVRQETRRTQVPRQSQRSAERSNQQRSGKA